ITLAKEGFPITWDLARVLEVYQKTMKDWPSSMEIFYKPGGSLYRAGELLVQSDLAWSLEQIAKDGAAAFYEGAIADKIVTDMRANGGLITKKDLKKYTAIEVEPVWGTYKNYKVASMPPPSSGGIHLIQMLNILEAYDLKGIGSNTAQTIHLMTEAMKRAYADRSKHLGDPDFYDVPTNELVAKGYAEFLREGINEEKATPSSEIAPGNPVDYESEETTHFSVVDKDGNVVSNTYTLNFSFGTGIVADGTGILLNNEMADFLHKLGEPNAFGLMEGEANKVEPEKRMLSAMTPTIVFENDTPYLVTGSPGGSRIITSVLQVILNTLEHEMNVAEATHTPRIHHQWQPDVLYIEENLNKDTRVLLEAKGYKLEERTAMGSTQSILVKDGMLYGSSDPRRPDAFTKGY
ncbi:MAG: gamma-glutamyltransferase, partial [Cytophagales bacterium]|nr:gamma-glutamyltransferase [Cytophagales bacterium]